LKSAGSDAKRRREPKKMTAIHGGARRPEIPMKASEIVVMVVRAAVELGRCLRHCHFVVLIK
jgi:hypothetical protein